MGITGISTGFRLEGESAGVQDGLEVTKEYALTILDGKQMYWWVRIKMSIGLERVLPEPSNRFYGPKSGYLTIEDDAGFTKIVVAEQSIEGEWIARDEDIWV